MASEAPHGPGPSPGDESPRGDPPRRDGSAHAADRPVARAVERAAIDRVEQYLARATADGRVVFPLVELAAETALDPETVAAAMARLGRRDRFEVSRQAAEYGEHRWLVRV